MIFKLAQTIGNYLGYFYKTICRRDLPKIAQFGHTAHDQTLLSHFLSKRNWFIPSQESFRTTRRSSFRRFRSVTRDQNVTHETSLQRNDVGGKVSLASILDDIGLQDQKRIKRFLWSTKPIEKPNLGGTFGSGKSVPIVLVKARSHYSNSAATSNQHSVLL